MRMRLLRVRIWWWSLRWYRTPRSLDGVGGLQISHDLKTPLASITGYLDAIADGYADDPEKLNRYLGIISKKAQLLESRISALIEYAKQETRDWKTSLESVSLRGFLVEFCSLVEAEAQALA